MKSKKSRMKSNAMVVKLLGGRCETVPINVFQSFFRANQRQIIGYTRGYLC